MGNTTFEHYTRAGDYIQLDVVPAYVAPDLAGRLAYSVLNIYGAGHYATRSQGSANRYLVIHAASGDIVGYVHH